MKNKVFITRSILPAGIELLRSAGFEVSVNDLDRALSYEELKEKGHSADALITMLSDRIDEEFLTYNSHLKVISNYAVGTNNINITKAHELKIPIGNTPDVLTEATAEVALGLMISATRNFFSANACAQNGEWIDWHPTKHLGHGLRGKTLGIVGLGRIGMRLAEMCSSAFKMKIIYTANSDKINSMSATRVDLAELCTQSDFISLHTPLTDKTRNLIGKKELNAMKKSAVLINTSRGEIINQEDLFFALQEKNIFAAGLDVTTPEPLPVEHGLFKLKNVMILPHIGSATYEARNAMSILAAENIIAGINGSELKSWVDKKDLLP
ncbi:MAG: D-glycerate dehydrogenase [Bacteriovorax sp.]|nr:D-glycerate dehydrogenase [Bacteriovorax sp.]